MSRPRRLTYANVVSTIGVFLLLAGGTAIAAKGLAKNSVGPKQLKANAVTTAKIKKAAVTKAKLGKNAVTSAALADSSVTGSKIADGSVTGAKIAPGSTNFSQRVARLTKNELIPLDSASGVFQVGTYTQNVNEALQILGSIEVEFAAACTQPRSAQVFLVIDAPFLLSPTDIAGFAVVEDKGAGVVRERASFAPFPGGGSALYRSAPAASTSRAFSLYFAGANCAAGEGVNLLNTQIDLIGTK